MKRWAQFGKFIAVGLLNTAIGYAIYAALTLLGFGPSFALILTYAIAVPLNYLTTGRVVFDTSNFSALARFIASYFAVYLVNLFVLTLLIDQGFGQLLAQAIAVPFMAILSFLIFKYFVFNKPQ